MDDETKFRIMLFDPLTIQFPPGHISGRVVILLPPLHLQLYDLSMGMDLLAGAHIGADVQLVALSFDVGENGVGSEKIFEFIRRSREDLRVIWQAYQDELNKRGALLGENHE